MAIDALSDSIDLYNIHVDQAIPWSKLNEIAFQLGQFESKLFSQQSSNWIRNIKTQLLTAVDAYDGASQSIYEGCGSSMLSTYIKLFDNPKSDILAIQKSLLTDMLNIVIKHLEKAQIDLSNTLTTFYSIYEKFRSLLDQLKIDHSEDGDHFKNIVKKTVDENSDLFSFLMKGRLEKEAISEIKEKIKPVQTFLQKHSKHFDRLWLILLDYMGPH